MRYDVVIVGAGIGGAVLALDLGRRGWRVAMTDREAAQPRFPRPEILWGATLRALEAYGVSDTIRRTAALKLERIELGGEKPWLTFTREDLDAAGVEAWATNPGATRTIIADAAQATGYVDIHRGVAVTELLHADRRIAGIRGKRGDATLDLEARLVVGDDGGKSVVRTHLGIPIEFSTFPVEFVTAIVPRWPLPPNRARGWINFKGSADDLNACVFIPWPGTEGVILLPVPTERAKRVFEQPPEAFWASLERLTPLAGAVREQLVFPRDFSRIPRPFGHAASYVMDGAALIGDAVHPMTPAGGQGANASIWDALALSDVADAALRAGDLSRDRLAPYERVRRSINNRSVSFSRMARRLFRAGAFVPLAMVPILMGSMNALVWPKRRLIGSFSRTFVHRRSRTTKAAY